MKVTFDTEADSTEDLKSVLEMLNNALQKRTGGDLPKSGNEIFNVGNFVEAPKQEQFVDGKYKSEQKSEHPEQQQGGKTTGGGRVIPYQDLSGMMSNIFSNQSTRRAK